MHHSQVHVKAVHIEFRVSGVGHPKCSPDKYVQADSSGDGTLQRAVSRMVTFNVHITAGSTMARASAPGFLRCCPFPTAELCASPSGTLANAPSTAFHKAHIHGCTCYPPHQGQFCMQGTSLTSGTAFLPDSCITLSDTFFSAWFRQRMRQHVAARLPVWRRSLFSCAQAPCGFGLTAHRVPRVTHRSCSPRWILF